MSLDGRIRVLLVDDHPLVRIGLRRLLEGEADLVVVAEAGSADEAIAAQQQHDADAVVLDLRLGPDHGLDLLRKLHHTWPYLRVLVLSMQDQRIYAERCRRAGALGYLMKERAGIQVVDALRAVAAGKPWVDPSLPKAPAGAAANLSLENLSDREMEVFELMGEGLPTRALAARLGLSAKTIEAHQGHIKQKLGVAHVRELVRLSMAWRNVE